MKNPDKIFYDVIEGGFQCVNTVPTPSTPDAYLRKTLLEWLEEKHFSLTKQLEAQDDPVLWGQRNAFQQVIDKINSM